MEEQHSKTREKMEHTIEALKKDLGSISTGRATPKLLDTVKVEVYGSVMPLSQVATITTPDATTISIQVWDKSTVQTVESAIINSNLGFNPMTDGQLLRINVPKLSEERRREFCKLAKKYGEDKKISIRNSRREALDNIKKIESEFSEDKVHDFQDKIQKLTDEYIGEIDNLINSKEKDIMTN
ncbi:ribosome recycling factor [Pseudomonadota bacterium]